MNVHAAPWVVPIAAPPIRDGAVALDGDGRVAAIGAASELRARGENFFAHEGVLTPGLVNAHAHVELSHLAGEVPGGDGLAPWIARLLARRAAKNSAECATTAATENFDATAPTATAAAKNFDALLTAAGAAARTMAARGTVAVADVTNDDRVAPLLVEAGLDALVLEERVFDDAPARVPGGVVTAHATYTSGPEVLCAAAARSGGRLKSIHVEEDPAEAELLEHGTGPLADLLRARGATARGLRPIPWLDSLGVLGAGTLLVHLTAADDDSLALAARRGAIAVLCPRSNLHIGKKLPPVARLRAAGLDAALGTDSLASAPSLDVLADVQALARAGVEPAWLIAAATEGGARALDKPWLGALAVGKRPGLVVFGDRARSLADPIAWLAHEAADAPARRVAL